MTAIDARSPATVATVAGDPIQAPDFTLSAQDGASVRLADVLAANHAVLVFYRGHW